MINEHFFAASIAAVLVAASAVQAGEKQDGEIRVPARIEHVLLLSVDGLHALDVDRYVAAHPASALAGLVAHGVTYSNASLPAHSDSFPGLLALTTGGSPVSHGVFYDVSYDRSLYAPDNVTCSGPAGATVVFDESIDNYVAHVSQNTINPAALPRRLDRQGNCVPVYPHEFVKSNTLFEVVKSHGGTTAWSDKHPAYDLVNGPSGHGVDDLYTPEITNVDGFDATVSVVCTAENDQLKVAAVLNEIAGKRHDGTGQVGVPAVFGMNFQAVSVGQKLARDNSDGSCADDTPALGLAGRQGGYLDASGTPSAVLEYGLERTDAALASMIAALQRAGIYDRTLVVLTAKHGQSPIDPAKVSKPGHLGDLIVALGVPIPQALADAIQCGGGNCGLVQDDDVALIWLNDQAQSADVAAFLNLHAKALFIQNVFAGPSLAARFNDPAHDNRTPDLIVQPEYGSIYTGSGKKIAEHGGFAFADVNVGLVVANPRLQARTIKSAVETSQVAPTVLEALGLDGDALQAVRKEHTTVLPGLGDVRN